MTASSQGFPATPLDPVGEPSTLSLRRPSLGDDVYDALLTRLISSRIPPGARITVDGLVKELGVSQTPIRAALVRLEAEGLVIKTHLVGYSATPLPDRRRFEQIYELRLLLEPVAAAKAARSLTAAHRTKLEDLHAAMGAPSAEDARLAYGKFATWDAAFHAHIAMDGGSDLIAEALARLHTHMHLFRLQFHSRVTEEAIREHAAILAALKEGDARTAQDMMAQHILFSKRRMAPIFESLQ
jgi:DNA-binding GntR family transcriptional regulator